MNRFLTKEKQTIEIEEVIGLREELDSIESGGGGGGGGGGGDVIGSNSSVDNSVVFFNGTTGKLIKENTDFKFITGATYGDQLKVPDIETDDHSSVNAEIQKITNITSAVATPTPITTLSGELVAGVLNATQYRISGNDGVLLKNPNFNLIAGNFAGAFLNNGTNNILLGSSSGKSINDGTTCVFIGVNAGFHIQGTVANPVEHNVAIGTYSQQGLNSQSQGSGNVSVGQASLYTITTGNNNTCIGTNAGYGITSGIDNTMIGSNAGDTGNGDYNTCIGHNALTQGGSNRTAIGYISRCDADNQVCLGDTAVSQIINTGNGVCDLGSATHKFKDLHLSGGIIGMPYDVVFSATDEVNAITTTGQKMSLRCPRSFQTSKIKVSVVVAGGTGFALDIKLNGSLIQSVAQGSLLITNTVNSTAYNEDDIISVDVSNVGSSTAVGLKVYLIGKTV